jgi:exosortase
MTMADKWSNDPQYSHGFLVPLFAGYLLWHRRQLLPNPLPAPSFFGVVLILLGVATHLSAAYFFFDALGMISFLPVLVGVCLCFGGWPALRWAGPSIAFLLFMLPLPYTLEVALSHPLQRLATIASTYTLQTLGFAAVSEGNVILVDDARLGVLEACNGLGMLVTFFAMTTATVLVVRRPVIESAVIFISAVPIALVANVIRITATGILHVTVGTQVANIVFHDWAGWLMMPLALVMLWLELILLGRLLIDSEDEQAPVFGLGVGTPQRAHGTAAAAPASHEGDSQRRDMAHCNAAAKVV